MLTRVRRQYFEALFEGDRRKCRGIVNQGRQEGVSPTDILLDVIWPAMTKVDELFREDNIDFVAEHIATRINRTLADQMQVHLPVREPSGRNVIVSCSDAQNHELGAQIVADLFEADGWQVRFVGSGVPMDELVQLIGKVQPHLVIYFGTEPGGIPEVRRTLQLLRRIGASPHTAVLAIGGVFNRAQGLWIEVGADAFAADARSALTKARNGIKIREHLVPLEGQPKRRRRRKTFAKVSQ